MPLIIEVCNKCVGLSQVLQPQHQRAVSSPQVTLATTPMVTLRNPAPGHMVLGQQQVQLKDLQPGEDDTLAASRAPPCVRMCMCVMFIVIVLCLPGSVRPLASKQVSATALTPAQKNQLKEAGGTFK